MRSIITALSAAACSFVSLPAIAGLSYTFDSDAEGWGLFSDATEFEWDGTIGNNGLGAIKARDVTSGAYWFFSAPQADLGNLSGLYGNTVSYDIMGLQGNQNNTNLADLILVGNGLEIGIAAGVAPALNQWTSWSILVDASEDWKIVSSAGSATLTNTDATAEQIQSVLADLSGLYIRGEYTSGSDRAALDNVGFVPAPGALALLGMGGLVATRRRR